MTEQIRVNRELSWSLGPDQREHELDPQILRAEVDQLRRVILAILDVATDHGRYSICVPDDYVVAEGIVSTERSILGPGQMATFYTVGRGSHA